MGRKADLVVSATRELPALGAGDRPGRSISDMVGSIGASPASEATSSIAAACVITETWDVARSRSQRVTIGAGAPRPGESDGSPRDSELSRSSRR